MRRIMPGDGPQSRSERFPTPLETQRVLDPEDARDALFYAFAGIPDDGLVDLPGGWSVSLDHFAGGPGFSISSPNGETFLAIFEIDVDSPSATTEFVVWGGPSYAAGTERFPNLLEAARTYLRRMDGFDAGVRFPCWGDLTPEEYAITDGIDEGWTLLDLQRIVDLAAEEGL